MLRTTRFLIVLLAVTALLGPCPAGAFTADEGKAPMTVTLVRGDAADCGGDCPEWLALTGRVVPGSQNLLAAALARLGHRRLPVLLDSPGGETTVGIAMGRMIRAHRLDTTVASTVLTACEASDRACQTRLRTGEHPGHLAPPPVASAAACASACVFLLAGGVDRVVAPGTYVGVHQAMRVLTFHPVMNTFRILRRMVNGRAIEISRTLVATRALPIRVVKGAATQGMYSDFDRYLLAMGVDESIMPLMRATPPTGIHWLTLSELASTRIANDTVDAGTLISREAASQAAVAAPREVRLSAALTLRDGRRWKGIVAWRIDATTPGAPALVGDWDVPERHLRGSVTITADAAPGATTSFKILTRFTSDTGPDAAKVLAFQSPQLCDLSLCSDVIAGDRVNDRSAATFDVSGRWRIAFLTNLRQRDWLSFVVRTDEGWGSIALTLSSPDANAITDWERLCCAFAASDAPWNSPVTSLPAFPDHPDPFLVAGIRPVDPAAGRVPTSPRTFDMPALFDAAPMQQHGFPVPVHGSLTWIPLATPATVGDATALLGAAELSAAGLRVSIEAGSSKAGMLGRLTFRLHILTEDSTLFGPMERIVAMNGFDVHGHPMLLPSGVAAFAGKVGDEIHLDIPESGPIAGAFQVGFEDVKGRRVTLAFPFDPAVAALLQAAARRETARGS